MHWLFLFFISVLCADDLLMIAKEMMGSDLPEETQFVALSGLTNKSYLFEVEKKKYVIRVPGRGTEKFIDRQAEQLNSRQAYVHGFSPTAFLSFDSMTGRQLTSFVEEVKNFAFEEVYREDLMEQIAHFLHRIHTSFLPFQNRIDFIERMNRLESYLQEQGIPLPLEYCSLKSFFQNTPPLDCFEIAPSHGDPVPSNFVSVNGQLLLFDWEYAGLADPAADLAFLSTVMNYSKEQEENFLHFYSTSSLSLLKEKMIYFKPLIETWLGLWGILQATSCHKGQKDFFETFSMARWQRAQKFLHSTEYTQALEYLSLFHHKEGRLFRAFRLYPDIPLLASFPKLSDEWGLTQIEFGLWVCPYCGILNPIEKRGCMCPTCHLK